MLVETSLQELVSISTKQKHDSYNESSESNQYSQNEIAKLSRVENMFDRQMQEKINREHNERSHRARKISRTQFVMMTFLGIYGGPLIVENVAQTIGILYTVIGLCMVCAVYFIPQLLIYSELSSIVPCNHGYIAWLYRAFASHDRDRDVKSSYSDLLPFMHAINCIIAHGIQLPLCMVFFMQYLHIAIVTFSNSHFDINQYFYIQYLIKLCTLTLAVMVNIIGSKTLRRFSAFSCVIIFVLFVYPVANDFKHVRLAHFDPRQHGNIHLSDWCLGLCTLLWLYGGLHNMYMYGGQIAFPTDHFPTAFMIAIVSIFLLYQIPLLLSTAHSCSDFMDSNCWSNEFAFLSICIIAALSMFAKYSIVLCTQCRSLWAISQPFITLSSTGAFMPSTSHASLTPSTTSSPQHPHQRELETVLSSNIVFEDHLYRGSVRRIYIKILPQRWVGGLRSNVPLRAVLCVTLINAIVLIFEYEWKLLLQLNVLIECVCVLLRLTAFVKLRISAPSLRRSFKTRGGVFGAWVVVLLPLCIIVVLFVLAIYQSPYIVLAVVVINVLALMWYFLQRRYMKKAQYASRSGTPRKNSFSSLIPKDDRSNSQSYATTQVKNIW